MIDAAGSEAAARGGEPAAVIDAVSVQAWVRRLAGWDPAVSPAGGLDRAGQVDLLRALEELKCAAEAAQALAAVELDVSVRAEEHRRGVPRARQGRGVAAQVALARRESPARGRQHLGLATVLRAELPHTLAAFRRGRISEWRATLLARETACLSREHRLVMDAELASDPARVEAMGEGELVASAKRLAYALDPLAAVCRRRRAESERRVSLRPAPDVMTHLSALLPMKDGVALYAALDREAAALVAAGDGRGRGQIMADTLVGRVLGTGCRPARSPADAARSTSAPSVPAADPAAAAGQRTPTRAGTARATGTRGAAAGDDRTETADRDDQTTTVDRQDWTGTAAGAHPSMGEVPVMIHLVVSDAVLLHGAAGDAHVDGYGPVPADLARELAAESAWLRRLYVSPETGHLVAADSRSRCFPPRLAQLVRIRDQYCRTPWCDAPIRHVDHVQDVDRGGSTSLVNAQGLCAACNYAKQAPGWTARPRPGPRHTVQTTTPTGHRYASTAPMLGDVGPPQNPNPALDPAVAPPWTLAS